MDCIAKFEGMRNCFQAHPDVYKDELMDDEEIDAEIEKEKQELAKEISDRRKTNESTIPQQQFSLRRLQPLELTTALSLRLAMIQFSVSKNHLCTKPLVDMLTIGRPYQSYLRNFR